MRTPTTTIMSEPGAADATGDTDSSCGSIFPLAVTTKLDPEGSSFPVAEKVQFPSPFEDPAHLEAHAYLVKEVHEALLRRGLVDMVKACGKSQSIFNLPCYLLQA